jgi:hypothetical protein
VSADKLAGLPEGERQEKMAKFLRVNNAKTAIVDHLKKVESGEE